MTPPLRSPRRPAAVAVGAAALVVAATGILSPTAGRAQPAARATALVVRGRITGPDSQPVAGALVSLTIGGTPGDSTKADAAGAYQVAASRDGAIVLRVRALGYQPAQRPVERPATGQAVVVDVRLQKNAVTLSTVKVQE